MKISKDIPAKNIDIDIQHIVINLVGRSAKIVMNVEGRREEKNINIMPIYNSGNATQKQVIRQFFKGIVSKALDVNLSEVPDIFN